MAARSEMFWLSRSPWRGINIVGKEHYDMNLSKVWHRTPSVSRSTTSRKRGSLGPSWQPPLHENFKKKRCRTFLESFSYTVSVPRIRNKNCSGQAFIDLAPAEKSSRFFKSVGLGS